MIGLFFWLGFKNGLVIEFIILIHENSISIIYWFIAIHIIAALYHRFRSDGVWNSMVPIWLEKN
jgi:cytochrome b561